MKYTASNKQRFEKVYKKTVTLPKAPNMGKSNFWKGNEYLAYLINEYKSSYHSDSKAQQEFKSWFESEAYPLLAQAGINFDLRQAATSYNPRCNPEYEEYGNFFGGSILCSRSMGGMFRVNELMEKTGIKPENMHYIALPGRARAQTLVLRYFNMYANWSARDENGEYIDRTIELWFYTPPNIKNMADRNFRDITARSTMLGREPRPEETDLLAEYKAAQEYDPIQAIFEKFTQCADRLENKDIFAYGTIVNLLEAIAGTSTSREKVTASIQGIKKKDPSFGYIGEDNTSVIVCPQKATNPKGLEGEVFSYKFFGGGRETGRIGLLTGERKPGATWCTAVDGGTHYKKYTNEGNILLYFVKKADEDLGAIRFSILHNSTFEDFVKEFNRAYMLSLQYRASEKLIEAGQEQAEKQVPNYSQEKLESIVDSDDGPGSVSSWSKLRSLINVIIQSSSVWIDECRGISNQHMYFTDFIRKYTDIRLDLDDSKTYAQQFELLLGWIKKYLFSS